MVCLVKSSVTKEAVLKRIAFLLENYRQISVGEKVCKRCGLAGTDKWLITRISRKWSGQAQKQGQ